MPNIRNVLVRAVGVIALGVALTTLPGGGSAAMAATNGDILIGTTATSVCPDPRDCPSPAASNGEIVIGTNATVCSDPKTCPQPSGAVMAASNGDILIGTTATGVCPDPKECPSPGIRA
jgi:hypothetical protein